MRVYRQLPISELFFVKLCGSAKRGFKRHVSAFDIMAQSHETAGVADKKLSSSGHEFCKSNNNYFSKYYKHVILV